jgi:hypothetical protein
MHRIPCQYLDLHDQIRVVLTDNFIGITARITFPDAHFSLSIRREWNHFWVQDVWGAKYLNTEGGRRQRVGTILMRTAIQYLQQLEDADHPRFTGLLVATHDETPTQMAERFAFFARFGIAPNPASQRFDTPVTALTPVIGKAFAFDASVCPPLRDVRACQ